MLYKASSGEIEPPAKAERLTPLLERMLASDPAERPSMDEVERELRALLPDAEPDVSVLATTLPEAEVAAAPAVPAVPATVAVPPPGEVATVSPGARKGMIAVGAGAALLCVAVVVAILLVVRQKPPTDNAAPPVLQQPSNSASVTPPPSASPSPSATSASVTTSPASTPVSPASATTTAGQALEAYYRLLPGNLPEAWKLLTDKFRASRGQTYERYSNFWGQYKSVTASNVKDIGGGRVTAHVVYDGGKPEDDTFTLVQEGGVWKIDVQS